jgi:hypothetical protein
MSNDSVNTLQIVYVIFWAVIASLALFLKFSKSKKQNEPKKNVKYRVGKKQGRAILEVETGKEYLIFPQGKEDLALYFCDWLNTSVYRETETKRLVLKLLEERLDYSIEQKNKNKELESYWYGVEAEIKELIRIIQKDEFYEA